MPQPSSWLDIIVPIVSIGAFLFWRFVVPNFPAARAAKIYSNVMTAKQIATDAVNKVEVQSDPRTSGELKKERAIEDIQKGLRHLNIEIESSRIDAFIESAVLAIGLAQGKYAKKAVDPLAQRSLIDPTINPQATRPPYQ